LHTLNIESFDRDGDRVTIGLEGNSLIVLDWATKKYGIVLDGVEVARDDSTFCPVDNDKIAFYALAPQTLTATLPMGWKAEEMVAVALQLTNVFQWISALMETRSEFQRVRSSQS
jgi:hypothetical protein